MDLCIARSGWRFPKCNLQVLWAARDRCSGRPQTLPKEGQGDLNPLLDMVRRAFSPRPTWHNARVRHAERHRIGQKFVPEGFKRPATRRSMSGPPKAEKPQ